MRSTLSLAVAGCLLLGTIALRAGEQGGPPPTPPAGGGQGAPAAPGRQGGGGRGATFPAQQRPPGDPALIAKGAAIYGIHCRACHGPDLRGGDIGGPNLLRSQLALNDLDGELIGPGHYTGPSESRACPSCRRCRSRPTTSRPWRRTSTRAGHHARAGIAAAGHRGQPDILVGDAKAGEAYFQTNCTKCHSPAGDLQGLASRFADPVQLQNLWVGGGGGGRGRGAAPEPGPDRSGDGRRCTLSRRPED